MVIVFTLLGAGCPNIPPTFFISCESQTRYSKTLKFSEQYIRDHLSGTKERIWICSDYDAVSSFFLYCLVQPNQVIHLRTMYIIRIRQSFKQSTCTLYASEIFLFKVFMNVCRLTGEMPID